MYTNINELFLWSLINSFKFKDLTQKMIPKSIRMPSLNAICLSANVWLVNVWLANVGLLEK